MKIYQVGGSIRDKLMGIDTPTDIDYVVVGSTVAEMLQSGYQQVGKSFPVFIHPRTKHEYALARLETKTGDKHTDFDFTFTPNITLEQDLARRDFRCNAIALDVENGEIIDPFDGRTDIKNKVLHHVNTKHFPEDPLRILRMCRFAAQLNFTIHPDTMILAQQMVKSGMLDYLPSERIWQELEKALKYPNFYKFVVAAEQCKIWPIKNNTIKTLQQAGEENSYIKFALFDQGNGLLKAPQRYAKFSRATSKYKAYLQHLSVTKALEIIDNLGNDLENFISVCKYNVANEDNIVILQKVADISKTIKASDMPNYSNLPKDATFGKQYHKFRLKKIESLL